MQSSYYFFIFLSLLHQITFGMDKQLLHVSCVDSYVEQYEFHKDQATSPSANRDTYSTISNEEQFKTVFDYYNSQSPSHCSIACLALLELVTKKQHTEVIMDVVRKTPNEQIDFITQLLESKALKKLVIPQQVSQLLSSTFFKLDNCNVISDYALDKLCNIHQNPKTNTFSNDLLRLQVFYTTFYNTLINIVPTSPQEKNILSEIFFLMLDRQKQAEIVVLELCKEKQNLPFAKQLSEIYSLIVNSKFFLESFKFNYENRLENFAQEPLQDALVYILCSIESTCIILKHIGCNNQIKPLEVMLNDAQISTQLITANLTMLKELLVYNTINNLLSQNNIMQCLQDSKEFGRQAITLLSTVQRNYVKTPQQKKLLQQLIESIFFATHVLINV